MKKILLETPSRRLLSLLLGLFSALLLIFLKLNPVLGQRLDEIENNTYDYRIQLRPTHALSGNLLLVGLTDFDMDYWENEILTRSHHFEVMQTLSNLGVESILFDIVFVAERTEEQARALAPHDMDPSLVPRGDEDLAFQMMLTKTYLPYHFYIDQRYPPNAEFELRKAEVTDAWSIPYDDSMGGEFGPGHEAAEIKLPVPGLIRAVAPNLGHINVRPDSDGVVRRIPLLIRYRTEALGDGLYPSISLRHVLDRLGVDLSDLRVRFGDAIEFDHGDPPRTTRIPINKYGEMLINFRQGSEFTESGFSSETILLLGMQLDEWRSLPAEGRSPLEEFDLYGNKVPRSLFRGANVLFGEVAVASTDIRATSIDRALPMITVHANAIGSIISGDFVHTVPWWVEPLMTVMVGLIAGYIFGRIGYIRSFMFGGMATLCYIAFTWLAFSLWSLWLPIVLPVFTLMVSGVLILLYHLVIEDKRQRIVRNAFEAYTSPEVVDVILQNLDDPALWGTKRRVTTLFVDIRGFTTLTEQSPPEIVVEILNEYYEVAVDAIRRHKGIPNKFIGDEIMALFNAPHSIENSEEAACRAAVDIQLSVARLNRERFKAEFGREITCGVGVNTGEVIVGIVGKEKIEYTALGDDVNIASRLQGRARPGQVLIGQSTHEALQRTGSDFLKTAVWEVRSIPEIVLKGLTRRFDVYELCYERRLKARA